MLLSQLVLVLLGSAAGTRAVWPFKQQRGRSESLFNAGTLGLPADAGRVVALGDMDGDQDTDLFVLSQDRRKLQAWKWKRSSHRYEPGDELKFEHDVVNVVPGDWNADGRLDVLVMTMVGSQGGWWSGTDLHIDLTVFITGPDGLGTGGRWELPGSTLSQPIIFDDDGYMLPSLLGYFKSKAHGPLVKSWRNNGSHSGLTEAPLYHGQPCELVARHSSAYLDMDGDCVPDLVLHCARARANKRGMQVWTADAGTRGDNGYSLAKEFELPSGSRSLSFADMNRNGAMDIVFPTCKTAKQTNGRGSDCTIDIAWAKQAPLCSGEKSQYQSRLDFDMVKGQKEVITMQCRGTAELCTADKHFDFDFDEEGEYKTSIPVADLFGDNVDILITVPGDQNIPLPIRAGDFDLDGYPDLLLTVSDGTNSTVKVLRNVPCGNGVKGCNTPVSGGRGFIVAGGKGWEALESITDAVGASWIDIDDDGSLDIMVHRTGEQTGETITFIQNNFYHDAFFLKAQVLNGACDRECQPSDGSKPYSGLGVSYSGATYTFTAFDANDKRHAQKVPQLPQTAYHALMSPHTFIGLGRSNNYVENLEVGTSLRSERPRKLEALIPNSQVIINPPWVRAKRKGEPVTTRSKEWRTELFLHPGDWIPWVGAAVIGTVVTLGMVVVWLGEREKREDENERRRALHAINFQAL